MGSSLCSFEAPSIVYQRPAHCVGKPRPQSQQQQQQQHQAVAQRRSSRPPHLQLPSPANRRSHPPPSFGRAADSDSDWEAVLPHTTRPVGETHPDEEAALHQLVDWTTNRRGGSSSRRSHSNNNSTKSQESPFVAAQSAGNTSQLSPLVPLPHHGTPQHQLPVYLQSLSRSGGHQQQQQLPTHYPPPLHPPQPTPNPFEGPHSARLAPSLGSFPNYSGASYHQHYHHQQQQLQQHHHPMAGTGTTTRSSLNDITATSSSGLARSIGGANNSRGSSSGRQSAAYSTNNHSHNNNNSGRSLLSVPRLSNSAGGGGGSGSAAKLEGSGDHHHPPSSSSTNTSLHASAQRMGSTDSGGGEGSGKKWWMGAPQHTTNTTTTQEGFDFEWSGSVALQEEYQRARRAAAGNSLPPPAPPPPSAPTYGGDPSRKRHTNREGEEAELSTPSSLASRQPRSDIPVPPAPSSQGHNRHSHLPPQAPSQAPPLPPQQQQQQQQPSASGRGPTLHRLSSGGGGGGGGSPTTHALRLSFLEREATTGGSLPPPVTPATTPTTAANSVAEPSPGGGGGIVVSADDGSVGAFRPARRGSNRSLNGVPRPGSGGTQPDSSSTTTPGGGGGLGALPGTGFSQGADSCSLGSGQRSTVSNTSQGGVKSHHQQHYGFSSLDSGQGSPRGGQSAGAPSTPLSSMQPQQQQQQRQHVLPSTVSHSSMSRGNHPSGGGGGSVTNNNKDSGGGGNGSTTSIVVPRPLTILGNGAVVPIGLPLMFPGLGGGGAGLTSPVAVVTGVATSAPPVSPFRDVLRSMGSSYDGGSSLHSSSRGSTGLGAGGGPLLYAQQSPYGSLSNQPSLTDSSGGGGVVYHQRGLAQSGMDKLEEAELHSGSVAQSEHTRCFAAEDGPVFGCGGEGATTRATVMHRVPSQPAAHQLLTPFSGVGSDPLSVHNYDVAEHTP